MCQRRKNGVLFTPQSAFKVHSKNWFLDYSAKKILILKNIQMLIVKLRIKQYFHKEFFFEKSGFFILMKCFRFMLLKLSVFLWYIQDLIYLPDGSVYLSF